MIPLTLRISNFRSFREPQNFNFPQKPGLYFMQGINSAEPRLEANGSGKSSVWDALAWVWFDKTPRGLRAGDVCNWGAKKGTEVAFIFMKPEDGGIYRLRRTWGPNSWTLDCDGEKTIDLTKEKDNPALSWLSLSFESFLNSVLTAQGQSMFLDMKHDIQAKLFSDVMGLDRWLDYSMKASKAASDHDRKMRDAERELSRLDGELAALGKHDWRVDSAAWEEKQRGKRRGVVDLYELKMAQRKKLKAAITEAEALVAKVRESTSTKSTDTLKRLGTELEKYERDERIIDVDLARIETACDALIEHIAKLTETSTCPACGQAMTASHRNAEMERAKRQRDVYEREIDRLGDMLRRVRTDHDAAGLEHKQLKEQMDAARTQLDEAQRWLGSANRAFDLNERDLDALEDEGERLAEEVNPYADAQAREQRERTRLGVLRDELSEQLDALATRHSLFSYWVRGFKELRLSLIAEALTELEVEVNSGVDALGLLGWEMQFEVDRETKGGNIQRGFNCFVRSPHNEAAVPWSAWSGGEGQRLRLAGTMGLADLIRSRTGTPLALEVWDEPTEGLSPQGITDLLEALTARAQREQRVIFIVDHRSHDFGGFAGSVKITKGKRGSVVESAYN